MCVFIFSMEAGKYFTLFLNKLSHRKFLFLSGI